MYKYSFLFLLYFLSLSAVCQEKWTLNRCIEYCISNNLEVKNATIYEEIANIDKKQVKWNYLPEVYAGSNVGMNLGRSVDPNDNSIVKTSFLGSSYYVNASLELFSGFSQLNKLAYQKYLSLSAESTYRKFEDELAFSVMNVFFDVVYFSELTVIAKEQRELSRLILKRTEILVTTGLKAEADLLEVKANVERDELFFIQAQNQLTAAQVNLKRAMNITYDTELMLETPSDSVFPIVSNNLVSDELYQSFSEQSLKLNIIENEWKANQKKVGLSRAGYYPSLRLQASYSTGYYETFKDSDGKTFPFGEQFKNNQSQYVGLALTIPIFAMNQVRFGVKRAKLQSEITKNLYDKAKQDLQLEIVENINGLVATSKELTQVQNQLEADRLAFEAAQKKYEKGMISVVDFYTTKNRLGATKGLALRTKLTLEIMRRTIDFYRGIRFWQSGE